MTAKAPAPECSTGELERRLFNKYHGEDFALCFDVRNSAGFSATRHGEFVTTVNAGSNT